MPAAAYSSSSSVIWARVWPEQVRWGIAGNGWVRLTSMTMSRVRSRVEPPAP